MVDLKLRQVLIRDEPRGKQPTYHPPVLAPGADDADCSRHRPSCCVLLRRISVTSSLDGFCQWVAGGGGTAEPEVSRQSRLSVIDLQKLYAVVKVRFERLRKIAWPSPNR